jgi:hypothetical protein
MSLVSAQPEKIFFGLEHLRTRRFLRQIEIALGTGHAVWALVEKVVGAVAVAKVVKLPRFRGGGA